MRHVTGLIAFLFAIGGSGGAYSLETQPVSNEASNFDLSATSFDVLSIEQGLVGAFAIEIVRLSTGHLEYIHSRDGQVVFETQDRIAFEKWLRESWLGQSADTRMDARQVRKRSFRMGPGIYGIVPHGTGVCVAYFVNAGRKVRAALTRPATEVLFTGTHCSDRSGESVVADLLDDIDAVKLRR